MRAGLALVAVLGLGGCVTTAPCEPGERAGETAQLFFRRNIGPTLGVDEAAFQDFVARELVPRFPNGLTIVAAEGRWRGADGAMIEEEAKLVILAAEGGVDRRALAEARTAYRTRFSQEAVLQSVSRACLVF
jgi:hypothetical protein